MSQWNNACEIFDLGLRLGCAAIQTDVCDQGLLNFGQLIFVNNWKKLPSKSSHYLDHGCLQTRLLFCWHCKKGAWPEGRVVLRSADLQTGWLHPGWPISLWEHYRWGIHTPTLIFCWAWPWEFPFIFREKLIFNLFQEIWNYNNKVLL